MTRLAFAGKCGSLGRQRVQRTLRHCTRGAEQTGLPQHAAERERAHTHPAAMQEVAAGEETMLERRRVMRHELVANLP